MFADWLARATITLGERSRRGTREIRAWVWKSEKKPLCFPPCVCVRSPNAALMIFYCFNSLSTRIENPQWRSFSNFLQTDSRNCFLCFTVHLLLITSSYRETRPMKEGPPSHCYKEQMVECCGNAFNLDLKYVCFTINNCSPSFLSPSSLHHSASVRRRVRCHRGGLHHLPWLPSGVPPSPELSLDHHGAGALAAHRPQLQPAL